MRVQDNHARERRPQVRLDRGYIRRHIDEGDGDSRAELGLRLTVSVTWVLPANCCPDPGEDTATGTPSRHATTNS